MYKEILSRQNNRMEERKKPAHKHLAQAIIDFGNTIFPFLWHSGIIFQVDAWHKCSCRMDFPYLEYT